MMKKRVLMVSCEGLGNGGVQAIMMGIIRSLHTEFYFDMLLFTSEKRHYDEEFMKYGGKIFRIPHYEGKHRKLKSIDSITRDPKIYHKLLRILRNEQPYDIIHCNKEYESAPILKAAAIAKIPIRICHTHVIHRNHNFIKLILNNIRLKIIEKYANQLIGCSENACSTLYHSQYQIVNNFYDNTRFNYTNVNKSTKLIVTQVGAICPNKNQLFSIKVVKLLLEKGFDIKLKIIGFTMDNEYKNMLDEFIMINSISEMVEFLPGNSDIPSELSNSSCFIIPSFSEGFSISIVEAQAMGLHCFGSKAIPATTNCGNADYLDLSLGEETWANTILKWYQETGAEKHQCDTSKYAKSRIIDIYRKLYNGEKMCAQK